MVKLSYVVTVNSLHDIYSKRTFTFTYVHHRPWTHQPLCAVNLFTITVVHFFPINIVIKIGVKVISMFLQEKNQDTLIPLKNGVWGLFFLYVMEFWVALLWNPNSVKHDWSVQEKTDLRTLTMILFYDNYKDVFYIHLTWLVSPLLFKDNSRFLVFNFAN